MESRKKSMSRVNAQSARKLGDYESGQLPQRLREENERIHRQNEKLNKQLDAVKSNIPMNSAVRPLETQKLTNYSKFASKYKGAGPKLDPLVQKRLKVEVEDRYPGRNMLSVANLSDVSGKNIQVEYNERSVIAKRQNLLKKSHFMRKSHSMQRNISPKPYQGSKTMLRNNSVDLRGIFDESEQNQNLSIAPSDLNKDREPTLPNILSGDDSV